MAGDIVLQLRDTRYPGQLAMRLEAADEIERLRKVLEEINAEVRPELCSSELDLIVWWGRQVDRLQSIARFALVTRNAQCAPDDSFNRRQVEAVCRAVCTVEGVDPDSDVYGDSCDPQWTRYADAVAAALTPAERRCQKSRVKFIYPSDRECGCGEICENPGGKKCSAPADAVAAALTPAERSPSSKV